MSARARLFADRPESALAAVALIAPTLCLAVPNSVAPLLVVAAIAAGVLAWRSDRRPALPAAGVATVAAFVAWAAASALWALAPMAALRNAAMIAALAACGLWLIALARAASPEARRPVETALLAGVALALALLALEAVSAALLPRSLATLLWPKARAFEPFVFNRGVSLAAILLWPAALVMWRRHGSGLAVALVAAAALIISRFDSMAAGLGLAAGGLGLAFAIVGGRRAVTVTAIAVVALVLVAPLATSVVRPLAGDFRYTDSISHRASVWVFAAERIAERPLAGWGLDASRRIPGGDAHPPGREVPGLQLMPLHPHDFALQWWLELGGVGALLGAIAIATALSGLRDAPPDGRAAGLAAAAAALGVAAVGYGIWQAWWMAALWIALALTAAATAPVDRPARVAA